MLQNILMVAGALVAGVILGLKVIAPMTATKVDDDLLAKLESLEEMLKKLTA